jgi:hypothetical protein
LMAIMLAGHHALHPHCKPVLFNALLCNRLRTHHLALKHVDLSCLYPYQIWLSVDCDNQVALNPYLSYPYRSGSIGCQVQPTGFTVGESRCQGMFSK